jgi:hypothetical protein
LATLNPRRLIVSDTETKAPTPAVALKPRRAPEPEEFAATRARLNTLLTNMGLRPGDDTREPERGALARLAEVLDVSDQRVRVVYAGDVAVREDTLARWEATVAAHVAACGFCADKRAEGEEVPNGEGE